MKAWCQAAYSLDLLEHDAETGYKLTPYMDSLLADDKDPYCFAGVGRYYVEASKDYHHLPTLFKTGGIVVMNQRGIGLVEASSEFSKPVSYLTISEIIPKVSGLEEKLREGAKVLDLGCGSGILMISLAEEFQNCSFVGVDADKNSVDFATAEVRKSGLRERIRVECMNAAEISYEDEFDLVCMFYALHEMGDKRSRLKILKNCWKALKESGNIIIVEFPLPATIDSSNDKIRRIIMVDRLLEEVLMGADFLTTMDVYEALSEAGFRVIEKFELLGGYLVALCAEK